jgi:hypothetical protein
MTRVVSGMLSACIICALSTIALGSTVILPDNHGTITPRGDGVLALGNLSNWVDLDKGNLGSPLYFDDVNGSGQHDPGEAYAETDPGGWISASDNSCWLASGANMLAQAGAGDAQAIYDHYAFNGLEVAGATYTWDEGGLQEYVINQWMIDNPERVGSLNLEVNSYVGTWTISGFFVWEIDVRQTAIDALDSGAEVGIGMWPLMSDKSHLGGHALTIQEIAEVQPLFTVTDSDRDSDWETVGDLNTYNDAWYTSIGYYSWYNDFYANADGSSFYYPAGDFGYLAVLSGNASAELVSEPVPEPVSMIFFGTGVIGILGYVSRRKMEKAAS